MLLELAVTQHALCEVTEAEAVSQPPHLGFFSSYFSFSSAWATLQTHEGPGCPESAQPAPTLLDSHPLPLILSLGRGGPNVSALCRGQKGQDTELA